MSHKSGTGAEKHAVICPLPEKDIVMPSRTWLAISVFVFALTKRDE
jgi:hypothetical protein